MEKGPGKRLDPHRSIPEPRHRALRQRWSPLWVVGVGVVHEVTAAGHDPHLGLCWVLWARVASSSLWHQALGAPAKDRPGPEEGHPSGCLCCLSHQFGDTSHLPAGSWAETQQTRATHGPSGRCWVEMALVFVPRQGVPVPRDVQRSPQPGDTSVTHPAWQHCQCRKRIGGWLGPGAPASAVPCGALPAGHVPQGSHQGL